MDWGDRTGRRLKPRQLHIFMAVAEDGNMAKAADRLAISRPVISKTIAELERTLGVRLFDRSPKGVEPTLYGRALCKRSVAIFDELRQTLKEIEFLADPAAGELRVGCTETITAGLVSAVVDRLSRQHPKLVFQMELGSVPTLQFHFLRERKCEVIVGRRLTPAPEPDMAEEVLFHEQALVVAGPGNKWLGRRKIALASLAHEPWILAPVDIDAGAPFFEAFRAIGLEIPQARIVSGSLNLRKNFLATGRFLTLVPGSVLRFGRDRNVFKLLPVEMPRSEFPVVITTLKNRTLSPMAELFIHCVRDLARPPTKGRS